MPRHFDYQTVAREANLTEDEVAQLCASMRREFPGDDMLFELHVLRACMAIREGHVDVDAALARGATCARQALD